jgi:hypothetical protein
MSQAESSEELSAVIGQAIDEYAEVIHSGAGNFSAEEAEYRLAVCIIGAQIAVREGLAPPTETGRTLPWHEYMVDELSVRLSEHAVAEARSMPPVWWREVARHTLGDIYWKGHEPEGQTEQLKSLLGHGDNVRYTPHAKGTIPLYRTK